MFADAGAIAKRVDAEYADLVAGLPEGWTRKDFAVRAVRSELRGYLFARLDDKPIREAIWQQIKPPPSVREY